MMLWQRLRLWGDCVPREQFIGPIGTLFGLGGSETGSQERQIAEARRREQIAADRQKSQLQQQEGEQDAQAGRAMRIPRGRRLLLAATGEAGLPSTLG